MKKTIDTTMATADEKVLDALETAAKAKAEAPAAGNVKERLDKQQRKIASFAAQAQDVLTLINAGEKRTARLNLIVKPSVLEAARIKASATGVSINRLVETLLCLYVNRDDITITRE